MKTLIIDDERLARKELRSLLDEYTELEIIGECASPTEAKEKIKELKPDLIFLDVQMPGKTGFELLEELPEPKPEVIFVTAYDDYALKAFEVNALDYILKPVNSERLDTVLQGLAAKLEKSQTVAESSDTAVESELVLHESDQVFLKDREKCWYVSLKDIRYFESEGNYIRVWFHKEKPLILKSLNNLEQRLSEKEFFRTSRKHIVNLSWIENVETWFNGGLRFELKDGTKIEVSRRQASKFKDLKSL